MKTYLNIALSTHGTIPVRSECQVAFKGACPACKHAACPFVADKQVKGGRFVPLKPKRTGALKTTLKAASAWHTARSRRQARSTADLVAAVFLMAPRQHAIMQKRLETRTLRHTLVTVI